MKRPGGRERSERTRLFRSRPAVTSPSLAGVLAVLCGCPDRGPPRSPAPSPSSPPASVVVDTSAPAVAAAPADAAAVARPRGRYLVVLHGGSVLGEYDAHPLGGLPRRASALAAARAQADGVVHVDTGDTTLPEVPAAAPAGRALPDRAEVERRARLVLAALGAAGIDAFAPGETDLALGPARLRQLAKAARVPLVASNVLDRAGKPWFAPDRLVTAAGVPVGIFGLVTARSPEDAANAQAAGVTFADPQAAGRAAVAALRARGAQLIVALVHAGTGRDEAARIAAAIPGIDVLASGHAAPGASPPPAPAPGGAGPPLLEAGARGVSLARFDLHLVGEGTERWYDQRTVVLDGSFGRQPAARVLVEGYLGESRRRIAAGLPTGAGVHEPLPRKSRAGAAPEGPYENWTYASSAACDFCHKEEMAQWKTTAHAYALETLAGRARAADLSCLGCHTTGFERPGGTRVVATAQTYFASVGCEACHGPSVPHVRAQNRTGTRREVPEAVCLECHRPDKSLVPFEYRAALARVLGPGHGAP